MATLLEKIDGLTLGFYTFLTGIAAMITLQFGKWVKTFFNWAAKNLIAAGLEAINDYFKKNLLEPFMEKLAIILEKIAILFNNIDDLNQGQKDINERIDALDTNRIAKHNYKANYESLKQAIESKDEEVIKIHLETKKVSE